MGFVRIKIKKEYEKPGDIVHRGFLRVLESLKDDALLTSDGAYLYGIKEDDEIREVFTGNAINTPNCESVDDNDVRLMQVMQLVNGKSEHGKRLREAIKYAYGQGNDLGIEWPMEVIAKDRAVEHDGYVNGMTMLSPYSRSDIDGWDKLKHKFAFSAQLLERIGSKTEQSDKPVQKEKFDRSQPHANIVTIHHVDHGDDAIVRAFRNMAKENQKNIKR